MLENLNAIELIYSHKLQSLCCNLCWKLSISVCYYYCYWHLDEFQFNFLQWCFWGDEKWLNFELRRSYFVARLRLWEELMVSDYCLPVVVVLFLRFICVQSLIVLFSWRLSCCMSNQDRHWWHGAYNHCSSVTGRDGMSCWMTDWAIGCMHCEVDHAKPRGMARHGAHQKLNYV